MKSPYLAKMLYSDMKEIHDQIHDAYVIGKFSFWHLISPLYRILTCGYMDDRIPRLSSEPFLSISFTVVWQKPPKPLVLVSAT